VLKWLILLLFIVACTPSIAVDGRYVDYKKYKAYLDQKYGGDEMPQSTQH